MTHTLKPTKETLEVLSNFSDIQSNIVINEGSEILTMSSQINIMAIANLDQKFPREFAIYDLQELLSILELLDDVTIEFGEEKLVARNESGTESVVYYYASKEILKYPKKAIDPKPVDIRMTLTASLLEKMRKIRRTMRHGIVVFENGRLVVCSEKQAKGTSTDNFFEIAVPTAIVNDDVKSFRVALEIENMKFLEDDYVLEISKEGLSHFTGVNRKVQYFLPISKTSEFEV